MRSVEARLARVEQALRVAASGRCACPSGRPGIGHRVAYVNDWRTDAAQDGERTCRACGNERPVLEVEYVPDWRGREEAP